jgi:hypothetical protein
MTLCPQCGSRMARVHRALFQKAVYADRFRCPRCKARSARFQPYLADLVSTVRFIFSARSRCPRCESYDVYRLNRRDRIDSFSSSPIALFQFLLGAPVNKCPACRMHFYDWREPRKKAAAVHGGPDQSGTQQTTAPSSPQR